MFNFTTFGVTPSTLAAIASGDIDADLLPDLDVTFVDIWTILSTGSFITCSDITVLSISSSAVISES